MARLTENNKEVYLPYKSTEQIIREALESHEKIGKEYGWKFITIFFFVLIINDVFVCYFIKRF